MGNTNTTYTFLVGGGFSIFAYLIGGFDNLILSLAILMGVDFVSGVMVGAKNGIEQAKRLKKPGAALEEKVGVSSRIAFFGLMKKSAMILAVIVAVRMDMLMGSEKGFLRDALIMGFIGMEGISFIENLSKLGLILPEKFTQIFAQLSNNGALPKEPPKDGDV